MTHHAAEFAVHKATLKAVLLEGIHPSAVEVLRQGGYTHIEAHAKALAGAELLAALQGAHFVGIRSRTQLTAEVLEQASQLGAIGCFCIGTNQVDLKAAMRLGIPVFNAPFSNTRSVAELVLAQVIMLMRGIPEKNAILHRGGWVKSAAHSYEVRGKTLGIVGYGHIGTQIGVLAEQLGMRVVFHDIEAKLPLGNAREVAALDELLARLRALARRPREGGETRLALGGLELELRSHRALWRGQDVHLTPKEYALLELLLRVRGQLLTRAQIFDRLYNSQSEASDKVVEVILSTLRSKLAKAGAPDVIETRRGFGYVIP